MIRSEAKAALASKLGISLTGVTAGQNDLWTESDLNELVQTGIHLAWDFESWTFTEEALKTTWSSTDATAGYFNYPNTFEDESISPLTVNGKEWDKLAFADYRRYFEDNATGNDPIWAEYQRKIHVNPNAIAVGDEIVMHGKLRAPALTSDADRLPFSPEFDDNESSGNRAIVELAYGEALDSEKKKDTAKAEGVRKRAYTWLALLAAPIAARKSKAQNQGREFFKNVPDFLATRSTSRNTNIGNFP
jgi:hypothetical protein